MNGKSCFLPFFLVTIFLTAPSIGAEPPQPLRDTLAGPGWKFYAEAPIRYAPVMDQGRTYVGSDDGYVYCLGRRGEVVWKFTGGPSNRKLLTGGRLASAWRISTRPVVQNGRVYVTAGTFPMMGVYIYALDAATGRVLWVNDNGHDRFSGELGPRPNCFASIAPRGDLAVRDGRLLVPCGRLTGAAELDCETGELLKMPDGKKSNWARSHFFRYEDLDAIAQQKLGCFPPDAMASAILEHTGVKEGYCLVLGIGDGHLVEGLVSQSTLRIIVIDPNAAKADTLRKRLDAKGALGSRASVHEGSPLDFGLPPYIASLIVCGDTATIEPGISENVLQALRPYGGVLCLPAVAQQRLAGVELANSQIRAEGDWICLTRAGALPGSADWSHDNADAANTTCSTDTLVKAPFGVTWFAGPADQRHLYYENHHKNAALPQITAGRLLMEGPRLVSAFDVYTGRQLWQWRPPEDGKEPWSYHIERRPEVEWLFEPLVGRMVSSYDVVYVVSDGRLNAIDAATGEPAASFGFRERADWGAPRIVGDAMFLPAAQRVVALDRHSGSVLWERTDCGGSLAVGANKVFCLEHPWPDRFENPHTSATGRWTREIKDYEKIKRRGVGDVDLPKQRLWALDATSGKTIWSRTVSGRGVSQRIIYVADRDLLLITAKGKILRGADGEELGGMNVSELAVVRGDLLFNYGDPGVVSDLKSRQVNERLHPLTGRMESWNPGRDWKPSKGCGPVLASPHVLTFRSSFAAYLDVDDQMSGGSGVVNLGGFRTACHSTVVPANGMLVSANAGSGGCVCEYPFSTTLGMVHMPEMEKWGSYGNRAVQGPIVRLGLNLGAPGDRQDAHGTLWLDYPSVGGPSPDVPVLIEAHEPAWFRYHSSRVAGDGPAWVAASGCEGLRWLKVAINVKGVEKTVTYQRGSQTLEKEVIEPAFQTQPTEARPFTVRLYFAEPEDLKPGQRVFDVAVQGKTVLSKLDVVSEAGGPNRVLGKTCRGVLAGNDLTIELTPKTGRTLLCGVEIVEARVRSGQPTSLP
ncbi:MAG: outer membrane protein assembly factor BamB family protein [Planctomycetota bacterium]|jgi:outer membrane protein assembly factor BamB